jgi:hypothetical protein
MECKFWLDIENFEIETALEYNLTPQAKREIIKIVYEHFDYIAKTNDFQDTVQISVSN